MASTGELLQKGIDAAKAKQVAEARSILRRVVELEPRNETAWLWLSGVVETDEQRITCLENVLAINPDNKAAQKGLNILKQKAAIIKPLPETIEPPFPPQTPIATQSPTPPSSQAAIKPKRQLSPTMIWLSVTIILLVVCNVLVVLFIDNPFRSKGKSPTISTPRPTPTSARENGLSIGEHGILHIDGGATSHFVAADEEALKKLFRAIDAKDDYGMADLLLTEQVFSVKDGTRVLVIDKALYTTQIRILEGPYAGRSGWVPYEWVIAE